MLERYYYRILLSLAAFDKKYLSLCIELKYQIRRHRHGNCGPVSRTGTNTVSVFSNALNSEFKGKPNLLPKLANRNSKKQ